MDAPPVLRSSTAEGGRTTHQSGVALVVTLLLLSIITFMAVTFLVVSRAQRGSVVTDTDQEIARLAADTALERAKAELISTILATTNEFNYGLLASVNYINPYGFTNNSTNVYNVNYDFDQQTKQPLTAAERLQNIANLLFNPRPPVYITNRLAANSYDFRFYLDLNRNGRYDTNGYLPVLDFNGQPTGARDFFVGDPEWIGTLERPEFPHSADNKFINRYVYFAIPIGNTLDVNYIHNQARNPAKTSLDTLGRDFVRDQGVGTWEINLAAFLYDLNTNAWGGLYSDGYNPLNYTFSDPQGNAFADAASLLGYRYAKAVGLASVAALFTNGPSTFQNDGFDGYTSTTLLNAPGFVVDPDSNPLNLTTFPWSGADNPNHFNTTQDFLDENKTAPFINAPVPPATMTFTKRLLLAGAQTNSYDRYTFSRLVAQLGTESAPEPPGKMNLNYCNVDLNGNVVPNMATNFTPWKPEQFFTNAAIRLLANAGYTAGTGPTNILGAFNGVTNLQIQVWPTNFYTPSVHRMLQLAANIYDASTNRTFGVQEATNGFPSIFRPLFYRNGKDQVFIIGYREVTENATIFLNGEVKDLTLASDRRQLGGVRVGAGAEEPMAWGIPLVIGARKGYPNFNKLAMHTQVQVTRKLQFHRQGASPTAPVNEIDQMFVVGVTNSYSVEAWNSYATAQPRELRMVAIPLLNVGLTNLETGKLLNFNSWSYSETNGISPIPAYSWQGYNPANEGTSFRFPLTGSNVPYASRAFLANSTYRVGSDSFVPVTGQFERTPGTTNFYIPRWQLGLRTRARFAIIDNGLNRIVDYVNLDSALDPTDPNTFNITDTLASDVNCGDFYTPDGGRGSMWCTNRLGKVSDTAVPTFGILNQIAASLGEITVDWNSSRNEFPAGMTTAQAIEFFSGQFTPGFLRQSNTFAAPFQPFRNIYKVTRWEANDPLVHYTINDLKNLQRTNTVLVDNPDELLTDMLGKINRRYEPWGGNPKLGGNNAPAFDMTVKDPVARPPSVVSASARSDDWDFPKNKFPNVGWLGRVHRGTPWQTVYLKASAAAMPAWMNWCGDGQIVPNIGQISPNLVSVATNLASIPANAFVYDAVFSHPTNDWRLLDLFTSALDDNATRGQLSINQTNLAAWSAVLSGVAVLTNTPLSGVGGAPVFDPDGRLVPTPLIMQPAGVYDAANPVTWPPLVRIVNGLNTMRTNFPHQAFQTLGDILAVPELTVASPFLSTNPPPGKPGYVPVLSDAACERIPQQILGLLKCDHTPRFLVYSYGQTLKPAAKVPNGSFFGLVTNYEIRAEAATRALVRIDGAPGNPHAVVESFSVLPPD